MQVRLNRFVLCPAVDGGGSAAAAASNDADLENVNTHDHTATDMEEEECRVIPLPSKWVGYKEELQTIYRFS